MICIYYSFLTRYSITVCGMLVALQSCDLPKRTHDSVADGDDDKHCDNGRGDAILEEVIRVDEAVAQFVLLGDSGVSGGMWFNSRCHVGETGDGQAHAR